MTDPLVAPTSAHAAVHIGFGVVLGGWIVYDVVWRLFARVERAAMVVSFGLLAGVVWVLTHTLSGRAAFLHVGALLGTLMAGNVAMHIVPSQRRLVAATLAGTSQVERESAYAKQRSIHNNYMTFPLLFLMLSNHFSIAYAGKYSWLILAILLVGGALVRHWLNVRFEFRAWGYALVATMLASLAAVAVVINASNAVAASSSIESTPPVPFITASLVIRERCTPCHSEHPSMQSTPAPPAAVRFDSPEEIALWRDRIKQRAVIQRTMPLGNKTKMTEEERELLAQWFLTGAPVH
jgi:uncharacterized membrane protein